MPGESSETIKETIKFAEFVYTRVPWLKPSDISINYVQALPGTPLYEFGRHTGHIGADPDSEEAYLVSVSDRNASETTSSVNFTQAPAIDWYSWRSRILAAVNLAYIRKFGFDRYIRVLNGDNPFPTQGGQAWVPYCNYTSLDTATVRHLKRRFLVTRLPWLAIYSLPGLWVFGALRLAVNDQSKRAENTGKGRLALRLFWEWLSWHLYRRQRSEGETPRSLRKLLQTQYSPLPGDAPEVRHLREGR